MASSYEWRWYDGYDIDARTAKAAKAKAREMWRGSHYGRTPAMQAEKLAPGRYRVFVRIKQKNPRNRAAAVRTRVVRANKTTIRGYKSVTIEKLPDGRVQVTGRK